MPVAETRSHFSSSCFSRLSMAENLLSVTSPLALNTPSVVLSRSRALSSQPLRNVTCV